MYFMYCAFVHACFVAQSCPTLQAHGLYPAMLLSMGFPRQECWSGLPIPPPGDLHNPGIESVSPALQVDSLPAEPSVQVMSLSL